MSSHADAPFSDVALVGGHLYLDIMRVMLNGFRDMGGVTDAALVTEINGPIGVMRRRLRDWLLRARTP